MNQWSWWSHHPLYCSKSRSREVGSFLRCPTLLPKNDQETRDVGEFTLLHSRPCGRASLRIQHSSAAQRWRAEAWIWLCCLSTLGPWTSYPTFYDLALNLENRDHRTYLTELWGLNGDKVFKSLAGWLDQKGKQPALLCPWCQGLLVPEWNGVYLSGSQGVRQPGPGRRLKAWARLQDRRRCVGIFSTSS